MRPSPFTQPAQLRQIRIEIPRSAVISVRAFSAQEVEALVQVYFHQSAVGFGDEYPVIGGALVDFLFDLPRFARYGLHRRGAGRDGRGLQPSRTTLTPSSRSGLVRIPTARDHQPRDPTVKRQQIAFYPDCRFVASKAGRSTLARVTASSTAQ